MVAMTVMMAAGENQYGSQRKQGENCNCEKFLHIELLSSMGLSVSFFSYFNTDNRICQEVIS